MPARAEASGKDAESKTRHTTSQRGKIRSHLRGRSIGERSTNTNTGGAMLSKMRGHVFVVHADLRTLRCDHWLLPVDAGCSVSRSWWGTPSWRAIERHLPPAMTSDERVVEVPWTGSRRPWPTNVAGGRSTSELWLGESVRRFLQRASRAGHALERARPLLAMPVVGTGYGGKRRRAGDVLRVVLPVVYDFVEQHAVDVVVVAWTEEDLAAVQAARRQVAQVRSVWPLPAELQERAIALGAQASRGELAVFFGAGVSVAAGLPTWEGLLDRLAARAGFREEERTELAQLGAPDRAQLIATRFAQQNRDIGREVRECLDTDGEVGLPHAMLAGLPVAEFITTNYDDVFERACDATRRPVARLPYTPAREAQRWLLKMHGCVTVPSDIVLTRRDYMRYAERNAALAGIVQAMLITRHMLFVGFSLEDDNFHRIVDAVERAMGGQHPEGLGSVVSLMANPLAEQLWGDDLRWIALGTSSEALSELSRRFEIFLDAVSFYAADPQHLLHPRFAGVLTAEERELRELLVPLVRWMRANGPPAPEDPITAAWARVERLLRALGHENG